MTVTTCINTFVTRAGGSPKRSPRSPSPTHLLIGGLKGEDCVILQNPVKLTQEKIREGCSRIGLKACRSNIIDVNSIGTQQAPWTDPWLRLDKDNGKLWLSSFGIKEKNKSKAKERAHMKKVKELCSDWDTIDGLRSCDDWFPSRSIDITFCHPDEFIRIIRQFM